jgi:hypothetical protein
MENRWDWMLYCLPGTDSAEVAAWIQTDAMMRILQALFDGRGIRFSGRRWQGRRGDKEDCRRVLDELCAELERAGAFKVFGDDPDGDLVLALGPGSDGQPGSAGPV